jgi:hypothetical protein
MLVACKFSQSDAKCPKSDAGCQKNFRFSPKSDADARPDFRRAVFHLSRNISHLSQIPSGSGLDFPGFVPSVRPLLRPKAPTMAAAKDKEKPRRLDFQGPGLWD